MPELYHSTCSAFSNTSCRDKSSWSRSSVSSFDGSCDASLEDEDEDTDSSSTSTSSTSKSSIDSSGDGDVTCRQWENSNIFAPPATWADRRAECAQAWSDASRMHDGMVAGKPKRECPARRPDKLPKSKTRRECCVQELGAAWTECI